MTIAYKLLPHTMRGTLLTTDTPLLDTDSGFLLSFELPAEGEYVAVLTGQDGRDHTLRIGTEPIPLPPYLIKPQLIQVAVVEVKDSKPHKRWICPAFRLVSLATTGKLMYQVVEDYPGLPGEVRGLAEALETALGRIGVLEGQITAKEAQIEALGEAYNAAKHVVENLTERVEALEQE